MGVSPKDLGNLAVVVFQESTEPLSALDRRIRVGLRLSRWKQDDIALALMRTFCMMMRDILRQDMTKRALTKQNHLRQRFIFDGFNPAFRNPIQPG